MNHPAPVAHDEGDHLLAKYTIGVTSLSRRFYWRWSISHHG